MKKVLYVGIDVDDKAFHGAGFCEKTGELLEFSCKPTNGALLGKISRLKEKGFKLKTCYEATYIGYSLHRFLESRGVDNTIIAPSLIPELPSNKVKTDRLDCRKLAKYFAKDLLTPIHIPDKNDEQVRDFIRSRGFLVNQRSDLKKHILAASRRYGLNYKQESKGKNYWTKMHLDWLDQKLSTLDECIKINIKLLFNQYDALTRSIEEYDEKIAELANLKQYKKKKEALCCFRGISLLSAMTFITEIGDIKRFPHPGKLTSYAGLDVKEYSSGGKEKKFGITKMGNHRIRTTAVESCQKSSAEYRISKRLKADRKGQPQKIIDIADRCMKRLRKRSLRLQHANKHINKIKVACAREFLCFTWEALRAVA